MHNRFLITLCWLVFVSPVYCVPSKQQQLLLECIVFSHLEPDKTTSPSPDVLFDAVSEALAHTDQQAGSMPEITPATDAQETPATDAQETHASYADQQARSQSRDEDAHVQTTIAKESALVEPSSPVASEESNHPLVQKLQAAGYHPLYMRHAVASNGQASETIYFSHTPTAEHAMHVQGKLHLLVQKNSHLQGQWLIRNADTGVQALQINYFLPLHTWRYVDHPQYGLLVRLSPAQH